MSCDEPQVWEIIHDIVNEFHMLGFKGYTWPWDSCATKDRNIQFDTYCVKRVHFRIVDGYLRVSSCWECRYCFDVAIFMQFSNSCYGAHYIVVAPGHILEHVLCRKVISFCFLIFHPSKVLVIQFCALPGSSSDHGFNDSNIFRKTH